MTLNSISPQRISRRFIPKDGRCFMFNVQSRPANHHGMNLKTNWNFQVHHELFAFVDPGRLAYPASLLYGKPNGHAQKAVMVQRGQIVGTRNTSVCSENVSSVFSYWLFSIQSYKISQRSYAWVHNDICIVKERKMCT